MKENDPNSDVAACCEGGISCNINIEKEVKERYAQGAQEREEELCCPVSYNPEFLKVLPQEILDKDYGCGDPSQYLREGDVVLDLGSGAGKICYIASQVVGSKGKVVGVDFNPAMLELAKKYKDEIASKIGWDNVEFKWGKIQDLSTNLEELNARIQQKPISSLEEYFEFEDGIANQGRKNPLIENTSMDVIVSNCVLNLVRPADKKQLFREMYRVLKSTGRIAISDIVSDQPVPEHLQADATLWSGCISGAFEENDFIKAFEEAGFQNVRIAKRDEQPWKVVEGIEFRSVTVTANKTKSSGGCC